MNLWMINKIVVHKIFNFGVQIFIYIFFIIFNVGKTVIINDFCIMNDAFS